ncbi:hypothetical protein A0U92_03500 [Acetobacter aceti]|uniref:Uncharacterized protein n=2 Tax=Acetobacter aceti TaxID=435 RepID=A0A1U9KDX8_ACEAC|nr:hypothetical protein A0U92_03500 [Acetobacter aceti]
MRAQSMWVIFALCALPCQTALGQSAVFPGGEDDIQAPTTTEDTSCHIFKINNFDWSDGFFEKAGICAFRDEKVLKVVISYDLASKNADYLIESGLLDSYVINNDRSDNKFRFLDNLSGHLSLFYLKEIFKIFNNSDYAGISIEYTDNTKQDAPIFKILNFIMIKKIYDRINFDKFLYSDIPLVGSNYYRSEYFDANLLREEQGFWKK